MKHIFFLLLFIISVNTVFSLNAVEENKASLNFSSNQLSQKSGIKLNNNWQFYWKQLVSPKDIQEKIPLDTVNLTSWTNYLDNNSEHLPSLGYATYRLNFSIPKKRPRTSLYLPRINASSKIWINGVFITEIGRVGTSKTTTLHRKFTKIIPLETNETHFEIVIQVANFYHRKGGITKPIILGEDDLISEKKSIQNMVDMFFIGSFSFVGLLFLVFYLFLWNKDQAILYFSLMCIALSYHTLNQRYAPLSKIFEDINWVFLAKSEYISTYVIGLTASLFFDLILKNFVHKWYAKSILYILIVFTLFQIVLPAPYFTQLISPFLIFMLLNIGYMFIITIKSIIKKSKISKLLLINIVLAIFIFLGNIIFYLDKNEIALIYIKLGYILVFLLISMLLLQRFSISFHRLEKANFKGVKQRQEIIAQTKELSEVNLKLTENLKLLKNNNEELDDFNHIVSHDLKTPLISVYTLTSFIEEDLKEKMDNNIKSHIIMIKDVVSKMEDSINGLLEYSKIAKGNKSKETFSINKTLKEIVGLINPNNNCIINLPKNDINIYTSQIELEHVFQNLIENSLKYNDKEKAIIDISVVKNDNEYLFSISDNGPGVDKEYHDKIFKIFNQLDTIDNSTGVGLAIVKKIISNNNGVINVSSEKNKGLTISFSWKI
ncbi:ATP-binding protein [uncultured Polaribacter sp.]|uniref:sensor histidine kinase n=1 Tax=uncultured Polaribacter sp. TaxID=174711 RepID=UPI002602D38D|nr:sensor histidine kinase [uncultured Polaribacter sp.]